MSPEAFTALLAQSVKQAEEDLKELSKSYEEPTLRELDPDAYVN